jgi:hypothetical protein
MITSRTYIAQLPIYSARCTNFRIRATGKDLPCDYTFYVSSDSFLLTYYESIDPKHSSTQTALAGYTKAHGIDFPPQESSIALVLSRHGLSQKRKRKVVCIVFGRNA